MRKVALALSLVLCGSILFAQTLTELANKEKERRKAIEKSGKEAVAEVGEENLPGEESVSPAPQKPKKTRTASWDRKRAREDRDAEIQEVHEKLEAEEKRCWQDAARFGVPRDNDLPSCREHKRLLAVVQDLYRRR
jgi:hypothetical protein